MPVSSTQANWRFWGCYFAALLLFGFASAQTYTFSTLAGDAGYGSIDGIGSVARFHFPDGVAVDGSGNVFVADTRNHTIRKITAGGIVTTLAGTAGISGTADGTGSAARFNSPGGLAVDASGNVFVADTQNHAIRRITASGVVTTFAGTAGVSGATDAQGSAARFIAPAGVAVDGSGNLFVSEFSNTIRKITAAGVVTTLAGTGSVLGGSADGVGSAARFNRPAGVAVDGSGNVFVADYGNNTIRKITAAGVVTTLAGSAGIGGFGYSDGTGSGARFRSPSGVAVDGSGNVLVADYINHVIRKITASGAVTTLAGSGSLGSADGAGSAAEFRYPYGVAVDGSGNLIVADEGNSTIRKVTVGGVVTTLAGSAGGGRADGTGAAARFGAPYGVAADGGGNLFVADYSNYTIRKITASGVVTTLAGMAGSSGSADGAGGTARFYTPSGVAVDGSGNMFVADTYNNTIRKITPSGVVTTLAGLAGSSGSADGVGSVARFYYPQSVAVDSSGNVFVADLLNLTIRKITASGVVTTFAGRAGSQDSVDGTGSAARFSYPQGVAVDSSGNVFVADGAAIRRITAGGVVTTFAGKAFSAGSADGTGSTAQFRSASGVAVDSSGNVFVADEGNHTIRKITPDGVVTTLAGIAGSSGSADGTGSAARFSSPHSVAVDTNGNVYIADRDNYTIRKGVPVAAPGASRLVNLSILTALTAGGDTMTVGTVVGGAGTSGAKPLLMRAAGPSLTAFGLNGLLDDPKLEFFTGSTKKNENDNWGGVASVSAIFAQVGAFAYGSPNSKDAALYDPAVAPGDNSVRVSGVGGTGGAVIVELYDATPAASFTATTSRLVNISVLKNIGAGLTVGFVIGGAGNRTLLIRAVGPSLGAFGVGGLLADPQLILFAGQTKIGENDNWGGSVTLTAAFTQVGAFALANSTSKDAALLVTLSPGDYSVQVSGVGGTSGTALVEVYEVP